MMPAPQHALSRIEFILLLATLGTINSAAIDMMLPALPNIGDAFALANANDRSLVLTVFVLGLGLPQLVFGPLSDRFGRRTLLLLGLLLYTAAAFAAPFAPSFATLLVLRFLQGVGSAAGAVASQSAVRDLYAGRAMAEIMSLVWSIFMIVPILAPGAGQLVLLVGPWQAIFGLMGALGVACTLWAHFRLPETLVAANRRPLHISVIAEGFATVFGNRMALFYGLAGIFLFGAVLGFVNTAQQVYVGVFGLGQLFPLAFCIGPLAFAAANLLNARLVSRFGMRRLAHGAIFAFLILSLSWLGLSLAGMMPFWLFVAFLAAVTFSQGLAWGNVASLSMEPLGEVAGTASAVFGSFSTVGGAFLGYVVAQVFDGTTRPVTGAFFVFGLFILGCFLIAERGRLFGGKPGGSDASAPLHF